MQRSSLSVLAIALLAALPGLCGAAVARSAEVSDLPSETRWYAKGGRALPFVTDEEVEEFLRRAEIVDSKKLSSGINRPMRYDLVADGVKARAIFRTVEVANVQSGRSKNPLKAMRDSWVHEIAAWKLARLLGLDHVPPAVERTVDGRHGSLQLWVEGARTEAERIEAGDRPASPASWYLQRQTMAIFDNLIHNFDRNHGNLLVDGRGKVWFVDHTRSFPRRPELPATDQVRVCSRDLWERLQKLDRGVLEEAIGPWLDLPALRALLVRRDLVVERIEGLIEVEGEDAILLD